jgi:type VI secretion system protein VasD
MIIRYFNWRRAAFAAALCALVACGGSAPTKPISTKASIIASNEVNPNAQGRASSVHLLIFQLRDETAFMNADFSSLVEKEQETLGASLVERSEADLSPGDERELVLNISPEARVLGVVAELANYRNAQWRAFTRVPSREKERVVIRLDRNSTSIRVSK